MINNQVQKKKNLKILIKIKIKINIKKTKKKKKDLQNPDQIPLIIIKIKKNQKINIELF